MILYPLLFRYTFPLNASDHDMDTRISEKQKELAHLCRRFHVRRMELFGSAVQEDKIGNVGDFDFLVEFEDLPPKEYANAYFGLREALETMLDHPVDVVVPSAIKNPYFLRGIEATRTLLYAA